MLFNVFIIGWIFFNQIISNFKIGGLLSGILFVIGVIGLHYIPNYFCIWTSCKFFVYFFLGMIIRQFDISVKSKAKITMLFCLSIVSFAAVRLLMQFNGLFFKAVILALYLLCNIVGSIAAFFALLYVARNFAWENYSFLVDISRKSMLIYLLHQQIIYFSIAAFNGVVSPFTNVMINFLIAFICSYIISTLALKFKTLQFLLGDK